MAQQKVTEKLIENTFRFVGLPKKRLYDALVKIGPKDLKNPWKKTWTEDNPVQGFCYVVAEFVYHYLAPVGTKVMRMRDPNASTPKGNHWFLKWPDNTVVDLTIGQFENIPNYNAAKGAGFLTQQPSNRTKELAEFLGFTEDDRG